MFIILLKINKTRPAPPCTHSSSPTSSDCLLTARAHEITITNNFSIIALVFIVCWAVSFLLNSTTKKISLNFYFQPINILNLIRVLQGTKNNDDLIKSFIILSHSNSVLNPILYSYQLKDFRRALLKILKCNRQLSEAN